MKLTDIKTLQELSREYSIPFPTLQSRLKHLEENTDYRKLGKGQATILSPQGVKKILNE